MFGAPAPSATRVLNLDPGRQGDLAPRVDAWSIRVLLGPSCTSGQRGTTRGLGPGALRSACMEQTTPSRLLQVPMC